MMEKATREQVLEIIRHDLRELFRGIESAIRNNSIARREVEDFIGKAMSEEYNRFMSMSDMELAIDIIKNLSSKTLEKVLKEAHGSE